MVELKNRSLNEDINAWRSARSFRIDLPKELYIQPFLVFKIGNTIEMFSGGNFFRKSFNRKKVIANGIFPPLSNWNNFILKSY